ncbi:MAG TPA: RNB domain-containing ribonuclease, partial [Tepidisphaeraceae bacterium]|nr:RNB domain-containing ribonuclease [Tepidisphaeraceae bacterium]
REAQAIIDGADSIPHPHGPKTIADYEQSVVELLADMNTLARRLQKRRQHQGQISLDLPEVDLVLDEEGKIIDAVPEDQSFTHTLIEMFMVEANEAVARLLDSQNVPFLRRTHPEPEPQGAERLRQFVTVAGFKLPKQLDRKAIQALLHAVKGKPESHAISLAVLKSLTRAEYSPEPIGHFALASEHYCHFTSPIRRYADLTIHRLLDAYFAAGGGATRGGRKKPKIDPESVPSFEDLVELGRHLSFTERRADDAERELRQVKVLELLQKRIGEEFSGVVTGITNFGIFIQIQTFLIDGLIRYEDLMDDWWDVDEKSGQIRGQRSGTVIRIGDLAKVIVVRVEMARRELDLAITQLSGRARTAPPPEGKAKPKQKGPKKDLKKAKPPGPKSARGGGRSRPGGRRR